MTLVIAYIGKQGAVMAGDMREIAFQGDDSCIDELEHELYLCGVEGGMSERAPSARGR
ncbi:MAG: DUF2121 domain-containing protein [Methanoculleus sp.]|nr:DUF2121 domain-containing protein [Methanoculleus sp.]